MWNDKYSIEEFNEFQKNDFDVIFETGTWKGEGAMFLTKYRDTIITVEIDSTYYTTSTQNFVNNGFKYVEKIKFGDIELRVFEKGNKKIFSYFGNSIDVLDLVLRSDTNKTKYLFFLDAHWDKYQAQILEVFPLVEELKIIGKYGFSNSHIMVHDIKNPEHPEFGYDVLNYAPDKNLVISLDWIKEDLFNINKDFKLKWNQKSEQKRGILYIKP